MKAKPKILPKPTAKPFLKWAGGKTQLIPEIARLLPPDFASKKFTYVEPFLGSGAMLFWMLKTFPSMEKAVVNDINGDLINAYRQIASNPKELVSVLKELQNQYYELIDKEDEKKEFFYRQRDVYNARSEAKPVQAALFIFLNKTCFNGLYRVNKSNSFNVPMGSYKAPLICDEPNISAASEALKKVEIIEGDFEQTLTFAAPESFFYLDPPYKPLSDTSNFNSYAKSVFDDGEQIRLKNFCSKLNQAGGKWILSNSDVKGSEDTNNFFDEIYSDFTISRVKAKRIINSKSEKRGELSELLITNYRYEQTNIPHKCQLISW